MTVLLHQLLVRECRSEIPVPLPHQIHNLPANSRVDGVVRPLAAMPGHETRRASLPIAARQPLDLAHADTESLRRLAPPQTLLHHVPDHRRPIRFPDTHQPFYLPQFPIPPVQQKGTF